MTQPSNPDYHWTPAQMRQFLEAIAETGTITAACEAVGKSRRAAYNLRFRAEGRAFALGWDAALLVARACLADALMERAIAGYEVTSRRDPDSGEVTNRRIDNRVAYAMLARIDRMTGLGAAPEPGSDAALARIVAGDFERFLALVESGGQGSEAALFVAARTPCESAQDCELAEEAAAETVCEEDEEEPDPEARAAQMGVWWDDYSQSYQTDFPPPKDFYGHETGKFGGEFYSRALSAEEEERQRELVESRIAALRSAGEAAREAWFAAKEAA